MNAEGMIGKPGDKHYKCYHGSRKVLTITRAMRSSLNSSYLNVLIGSMLVAKSPL
jgi:hypothetical protein